MKKLLTGKILLLVCNYFIKYLLIVACSYRGVMAFIAILRRWVWLKYLIF